MIIIKGISKSIKRQYKKTVLSVFHRFAVSLLCSYRDCLSVSVLSLNIFIYIWAVLYRGGQSRLIIIITNSIINE